MSFLMRKARRTAFTVGVGALTSYFLDPQLGHQRRNELKDRVIGLAGTVREQRAAARTSDHGDGDPTGGGMPSEQVPGGRPTGYRDLAGTEPADRAVTGADLGAIGAV